jgi:hypothetical protein
MATKQQIPKVAATIVEFQDVFEGLSNEDNQWIIQHGKEANELFIDLIKNGKKENVLSNVLSQKILTFQGGGFSVRDNFSTSNPKVKFHNINSNFIDWFDDTVEIIDHKTNESVYSRRIRRQPIKDKDSVITELGGIEKAKLSFKEIYWLFLDDEFSVLPGDKNLISKTAPNKFITCNEKGVLCFIDFTWLWNGWKVKASPGGKSDLFFQSGDIVFSHQS